VAQRAALDRITDSRRKLLFRATSRTLQAVAVAVAVAGVVIIRPIRPVTHHRSPRVTVAAEVEEDSPIFPAFQANSSVVLGLGKERVLEMHLLNLAPMPRRMRPLSHHTATDLVGLFRQCPSQSNLRPTRRPTHHPTRRATLSRLLGKAINLLMINLNDSSGIVAEPEDMVTLGVGLGIVRLRSQNRKTTKSTRIRGRTIGNLDTLGTTALARHSPTLSKGTDFEPCTRFDYWRG